MASKSISILLAEDDIDDTAFFEKIIAELGLDVDLNIVSDGEALMQYLEKHQVDLPDILFLDLSMPGKNGFECLIEIKEKKELRHLPVVMLSTAFPSDLNYEDKIIKALSSFGANKFIRKRTDYAMLRSSIHEALIEICDVSNPKHTA